MKAWELQNAMGDIAFARWVEECRKEKEAEQ